VEMRHKYLGKTSRAAMQEKTPGYIWQDFCEALGIEVKPVLWDPWPGQAQDESPGWMWGWVSLSRSVVGTVFPPSYSWTGPGTEWIREEVTYGTPKLWDDHFCFMVPSLWYFALAAPVNQPGWASSSSGSEKLSVRNWTSWTWLLGIGWPMVMVVESWCWVSGD
jgi:hypothetical protein